MCKFSPFSFPLILLAAVLGSPDVYGQEPERESATAGAPAKHLILFSIDGLRPEFYLDETWPAPTLQQMAREGTHAQGVYGIFPSVTFPSHTTLVTGALPADHGILYNTPFLPGEATGEWYWYADAIKVPTLWDIVHEAGGTSAGLKWPVAVHATIDYNIPDVWGAAAQGTTTPEGFVEELRERVLGTGRVQGVTSAETAGPIAEYMIEEYTPNLVLIHVTNTDSAQHRHGREHVEVRRAVALADRVMTRMIAACRRAGILDETAVIVTGDHGFVDFTVRVQPNVWLVEAGLRDTTLTRDEWRATFKTAGGSAFLRLRDPDDREALEEVRNLLKNLPASTRLLFDVIDEEGLRKLGSDPDAVLALAAADGATFGESGSGEDAVPASGGSHGHHSDIEKMRTGFIAWGAGVREGGVIPLIRMEDIGPTGASLLGLSLPGATGAPHSEVFMQD